MRTVEHHRHSVHGGQLFGAASGRCGGVASAHHYEVAYVLLLKGFLLRISTFLKEFQCGD